MDWQRARRAPANGLLMARKPVSNWNFRRRLRSFHRPFVSPGDLVFDLGANVGDYTEAFVDLGASVIAVEPHPVIARSLIRRFSDTADVQVITKGVGEAAGTHRLYVSPRGGSALTTLSPEWARSMQDSGSFRAFSWKPAEEVEVTTLDALIDEFGRPAFIKIDVEGFELSVVRGLSRPVAALSLECHPEYRDRTLEAIQHLAALGRVELMYVPGQSARAAEKSMPGRPNEWWDVESLGRLLEAGRAGDFGDLVVRFPELDS